MSKPPNFLTWLVLQAGRPGPVGDLARAVKSAPDLWPNARKQFRGWIEHMAEMKAGDAEFAAHGVARMEYGQVYSPGPFGLPAFFSGGIGDSMLDVLAANGALVTYDDLGQQSWTYPPDAIPRIEAALRAWWMAGEVWAGYSEESRRAVLNRWDAEDLAAEKKAAIAKAESAKTAWEAQKERQRLARKAYA